MVIQSLISLGINKKKGQLKSDPYFHSLKRQRLRRGREMERKQGYYDTVMVIE